MGARRRCCCDCWVFSDNFNRDPSTDLGLDWNESLGEAKGDWEILFYNMTTYVLHEKYGETPGAGGTSDAIVFCKRAVPIRTIDGEETDGEMFIYVDVIDPQEDDIYRIYPCCEDNETTGSLVVEFEYTNETTHAWLITIGSDTLETTGEPSPVTGAVRLSVCADHTGEQTKACVGELGSSPTLYSDSDPGSGQYAALGHNNASTGALFDNFSIGELRIPTEICYECFCACDDFLLPYTLHGTFIHCSDGIDDRLGCMEGINWEMNAVSGLTTMIWYGEVEVTTVETPPVVQTIKFTLTCTEGWNLSIVIYKGGIEDVSCACFKSSWYGDPSNVACRTSDEEPTPEYYSTCDPFSLVYGPWETGVQDECNWCHKKLDPIDCVIAIPPDLVPTPIDPTLCNGVFWIEITE